MKKKSTFAQVILLILVAVLCVVTTAVLALVAGSSEKNWIDFANLNLSNMLPVLLIGGFFTCVVVGIAALCVSRSAFFKVKDFFKNLNNGGGEEK